MNSIHGGHRPFDLGLPGTPGGSWPSAPAPASHHGPARWLEGLDQGEGAALTADLPAGSHGLDAAGHAQRVLAALLGDEHA